MSLLVRVLIGLVLLALGFCVLKLFASRGPSGSPMSTSSFPSRPDSYFLEMRSSNGSISKEFVRGSLKRIEVHTPSSEIPQLHIYRPDKRVSWTAMPGSTTLRELAYPSASAATALAINSLTAWTEDGTAMIEGCECIHFLGRYQMPAGRAYEETYIDVANGLPIRHVTYDMFGKQSLVNERKAFNLQPPELELFEIPKGYTVGRSDENQ